MGNETVAVYDPRLLDDIPAWVIENIQAVSAYMKTRGHEEWTIAGVRSQAAHAREVEALRASGGEDSVAVIREALHKVIDAVGAYLLPDGISREDLISRVIEATDNPEIVRAMK